MRFYPGCINFRSLAEYDKRGHSGEKEKGKEWDLLVVVTECM
jgi:hypothetical protein